MPPDATDIIPAVLLGSIYDPPHPPQRVRSHTPLRVSFASPSVSPAPSDDPCPSPQQVPDRADSPTPPPTTDYHIFAVYQRDTAVSFIPDSGATHSLFVRQTPTSYTPSQSFPPTPVDHNLKSPMGSSSSPLHLDSSRSPTPTSQSARTCSATTTSPITYSVLRPYCGTATPPPSPTTISPYTQRATSSCTVPKPHDPTLGVFPYPDLRTFARPPSSDTNSTPRWSSLPTPRLDHHHTRRFITPSNVDGYTIIPT